MLLVKLAQWAQWVQLFKKELIMILEFFLYHLLWALMAYFIRRENTQKPQQSISVQSNQLLYWLYLLIIAFQLVLPLMGLSFFDSIYFYLKIVLLTSIGVFIDSFLTYLACFSFSHKILTLKISSKIWTQKISFIPLWLVLLWVSFSITMEYLLFFMNHDLSDLFFLGLLGAFGFPLTYFFADKLKVIRVNNPWPAYFYQGFFWFFFLPLMQLF